MTDLLGLRRWDVICRVVDHYGDAGVCLRLARTLAGVPGREVRLLVDQPRVVLDLIQPPPGGDAKQGWRDRSGLQICAWDAPTGHADVLLETFGCELPPSLAADMRVRRAAGHMVPVWLNLEHLSAEAWVEGCHGLPSPQASGLTRWFLFPGFTDRTAGLCGPPTRMADLPPAVASLVATTPAAADTPSHGDNDVREAAPRPLTGSVFCYRESPLPALLDAMQKGAQKVRLLVPAGMPGDLGGRSLGEHPGAVWQSDRLTLVRIPFLDQDVYDVLLSACDFNLVRGEDSFVRAQWAARPLLWAAYRQPADAHLEKLTAWLERCRMPPAWAALHGWFNGGTSGTGADPSSLWRDAANDLDAMNDWAAGWRERMLALPRLDEAIAEFALRHASQIQ